MKELTFDKHAKGKIFQDKYATNSKKIKNSVKIIVDGSLQSYKKRRGLT